jgi:hypothetical protein
MKLALAGLPCLASFNTQAALITQDITAPGRYWLIGAGSLLRGENAAHAGGLSDSYQLIFLNGAAALARSATTCRAAVLPTTTFPSYSPHTVAPSPDGDSGETRAG